MGRGRRYSTCLPLPLGRGSGRGKAVTFLQSLLAVPPLERDAWINRVFGLEVVPDDGPELPRDGVPYLPCAVGTLLRVAEHVRPSDVFVDLGSGVGRAMTVVHLLTGATAIGFEIQPALVEESRALTARLNLARVSSLHGDAAKVNVEGTVFFLYCPFSGERLEQVMNQLEVIARVREIRVCAVDLPLPSRGWLSLVSSDGDLTVYRSDLPSP